MDIWKSNKWQAYYGENELRCGIKVNYDKNVNADVKKAINEMVSWLRKEYIFPVRVRVYIKENVLVRCLDGTFAPDVFFWPYSRDIEPYIKFAVGDYDKLLHKLGRDDALATVLKALLRNFTHYFQWLNDIKLTPIGEQRQATRYARIRLDEYAQTRDHP